MPINKTQARKLLNTSEFALFESTTATALKDLSAAQVAAKIRRARTLRDKARDQFQRQRLSTRDRTGSKAGTSGAANARTESKVQVFEEVLARLEARAAKQEAQAAKAAATAAKKKASASRKTNKPLSSTRRKAANKADRAIAKADTRSEKSSAVAARKPAAKKAPAKKAPAKKAAAKAVTKKTATKPATAKKTAARKAPARKAPAPVSAKKKASAKRAAAKEVTGGKHLGYADARAEATARQSRFNEGRSKPIQAHISSHGRRTQAKRDSR